MANTVTQISVFVSSPSDMAEEREISVEVCRELTLDRGRRDGFVVNPLLWETHSRPSAGPSPQEAIFRDISESYDIFVGFIGHKFGTPTKNAGSGTEEEFDAAYSRYSTDRDVEILFYFRDPQAAPGKISAVELLKVEKFKEKISSQGVKYGSYTSADEFKTLLHRHLSSAITSILQPLPRAIVGPVSTIAESLDPLKNWNSVPGLDDEGLEELIAEATEKFERFGEAATEIGEAVGKLGVNFGDLTAQITAATTLGPSERQTAGKRLLDRTSMHMESYSRRVVEQLPFMHESMSSGLDAIRRAVVISNEDGLASEDDKMELRRTLTELRPIIVSGGSQVVGFSTAISNFPRLNSSLNRSKRRMLAVNSDIIDFFERCVKQIDSLLEELD